MVKVLLISLNECKRNLKRESKKHFTDLHIKYSLNIQALKGLPGKKCLCELSHDNNQTMNALAISL